MRELDRNLQHPHVASIAELLVVATLGDGERCSQSCFKNYSVLAGRTPGVVNKISGDKSFSLSSLGGRSKAVRLTFCIELQLSFSFACWLLPLGAGSHLKVLALRGSTSWSSGRLLQAHTFQYAFGL